MKQNMKQKSLRVLLTILVSCIAIAGIFLLPRPRAQAQAKEPVPAAAALLSASAPPKETRGGDWFVGDWLGLCTSDPETAETFTDFGSALLTYTDKAVLMRVYQTADGYGATIGSSAWKVTAHDAKSFRMVCTAQPQAGSGADFGREHQFYYDIGDIGAAEATFTFRGDVKSADRAARVPETGVLYGTAAMPAPLKTEYTFLLSYLPPAGERDETSGVYPCWYGGYAGMQGEFSCMALLGENSRDRRFFGQVLKRSDGYAAVSLTEDGYNTDGSRFGKRDMRGEDLTWLTLVDPATQAFWPTFRHYGTAGSPRWTDCSKDHALYYEREYIPQLEAESEKLETQPRTVWTENGILVRKALIQSAQTAEGSPSVAVDIEPALRAAGYQVETSLAGIRPGDTLEDAKKRYPLSVIREEEAQAAGLFGVYDSEGFTDYTDGNGLVLQTLPDGRIAQVSVYRAGYDTPDGRQVGSPYDRDRRSLEAKDAQLEFGYWGADMESGTISRISMTIVLDRVWDETMYDIDKDGKKERLTLSGRCAGGYLEQGTVHGDYEAGTVADDDYGTVPLLSIYKGETLLEQVPLHMYTYYLLPFFPDDMQKKHKDLVVCCPTGGTGGDAYYTLKKSGKNWRLTYLGIR